MLQTVFPSVFSIIFILFLIALFLSVGLAIYSFKNPSNKAANTFGILMFIISCWILLKIIALFVYSQPICELIQHINTLMAVLIAPLLLMVAIYHTHIPKWFGSIHAILLFVLPAIIYLLIFTSSFHHFLFYDFKVIVENQIPIYVFKNNFGYIAKNLYAYLLFICVFGILIKSLFTKNKIFRRQMILFIVGLFIPIFYDALYLLGISPLKNFNLAPVFLSIGNCFLAWSTVGYRFFKILSVARNLILDNMADVMIITNNENLVIDINLSGEILFECKKKNILNHSFYEVFKPCPGLTAHYSAPSSTNQFQVIKNGEKCHYEISISPFHGEDKQCLGNFILLHDITERIKSDTQIKKLSTAIEQAPVTVVITDLKGDIEYVNPAFSRITGYSPEEAMGSNPRVLKGNTPPETFVDLWKTLMAGQVWDGEFINRKKSGELYYEEAIIAPIKNDLGQIVNFIAIKTDITRRKNAEEKLKINEENLKSAQSIGNVGHWEFNNANENLFWSEQMFRIYELSPADFEPTYNNVVAFFHPEDRQKVEEEFAFSIQNHTQFEMQHRILTPQGKIKYIIERSQTNYDTNGNPLITIGSVADITELKLVEEELNKERALLRSLIDSIPDFIFVKDINGVYLLANHVIKKYFGHPWQKVVGRTDYDFVDPETAKFFLEKDRIVIESGKSKTNEEQVTYQNGEKVWLETTKTPFIGLDGKFQGIIGVSRDIDQRKKDEEALRTSRANLLALVENTYDTIWAIDTSYRLIFINEQFRNAFLLRFGVNLLPGMSIVDALPESIAEIWIPRYNRAIANERFAFEEEFEYDKIHIYFEVSMNPIIVNSQVIGVSVFSRDITERKKIENQLKERKDEIEAQNEELNVLNEELQITVIALHEAKAKAEEGEELFKQLMNYSPIYIYIKDLKLRSIRLSHNYQQLLGLPIDKLMGKTNNEIWPADYSKKLTDDDLRVLKEGKPIEVKDELDGRIYTSIKFPIYIEGKLRYLAGFSIDITESKMAQDKIQAQNETLQELNATKDKFFSIIAHDLKSPFNAILGFSDYLANNIEACSPDEIKVFASNINLSATQTYKLLENLLEWSKIQRGLVKPDFQMHNLWNMVSEMQSLNTENSKSKSILLQNNIKSDINIHCDIDMTKTILRNLISNAIKFTNENGLVTINASEKEHFIEIEIKDTGVGIPSTVVPHLFSIEKNTSTKGTANESGTGLGLLLCKELVENQGGKIWVQSIEGKGSSFHFTLYKTKPVNF